jgi:hypothetical protein
LLLLGHFSGQRAEAQALRVLLLARHGKLIGSKSNGPL